MYNKCKQIQFHQTQNLSNKVSSIYMIQSHYIYLSILLNRKPNPTFLKTKYMRENYKKK